MANGFGSGNSGWSSANIWNGNLGGRAWEFPAALMTPVLTMLDRPEPERGRFRGESRLELAVIHVRVGRVGEPRSS